MRPNTVRNENRDNGALVELDNILRIGHGPYGNVYCRVQYKNGKLSITGVEGPKSNGDAIGSCGQINDHLTADVTEFAPGWDAEKVAKFAAIWARWHLNDMRPGCEHQRTENWGAEELEIVTYKMTAEAFKLRDAALEEAASAAREGRVANLTDTGRALISPDWFKDKFTPPDADSPLSGMYEVKTRETKRAGWVRVEEHPRGVLNKPCPICGYKYGNKWIREEVPAEVLEYLASLPVADMSPAWI